MRERTCVASAWIHQLERSEIHDPAMGFSVFDRLMMLHPRSTIAIKYQVVFIIDRDLLAAPCRAIF